MGKPIAENAQSGFGRSEEQIGSRQQLGLSFDDLCGHFGAPDVLASSIRSGRLGGQRRAATVAYLRTAGEFRGGQLRYPQVAREYALLGHDAFIHKYVTPRSMNAASTLATTSTWARKAAHIQFAIAEPLACRSHVSNHASPIRLLSALSTGRTTVDRASPAHAHHSGGSGHAPRLRPRRNATNSRRRIEHAASSAFARMPGLPSARARASPANASGRLRHDCGTALQGDAGRKTPRKNRKKVK